MLVGVLETCQVSVVGCSGARPFVLGGRHGHRLGHVRRLGHEHLAVLEPVPTRAAVLHGRGEQLEVHAGAGACGAGLSLRAALAFWSLANKRLTWTKMGFCEREGIMS